MFFLGAVSITQKVLSTWSAATRCSFVAHFDLEHPPSTSPAATLRGAIFTDESSGGGQDFVTILIRGNVTPQARHRSSMLDSR
jgi:hypothetical protein